LNFQQAQDYLYSLIDYEKKPGMTRSLAEFRGFLSSIGDPQTKFKRSILVVGTKGKGSTASLLAASLMNSGLRVGLFTSPHLLDIRERITLNFEKIPSLQFSSYIEQLKPYTEGRRGIRTVFETLTAMSFLYFIEEEADFCIFEAGLGGRLDATNVLRQDLTVITPIHYDHTNILGNTLSAIAFEKASVIKPGTPTVSVLQEVKAMERIREIAYERDSPLTILDPSMWEVKELSDRGTRVTLRHQGRIHDLHTSLLGTFQALDSALAGLALIALGETPISYEGTQLRGRLDLVSRRPDIVVDGAHNPFSLEAVLSSIQEIFAFENLWVIFGACADKDLTGMLQLLGAHEAKLVLTPVRNPRGEDPEALRQIAERLGLDIENVASDCAEALRFARENAEDTDLILVTGSFYLAGEALGVLDDVPRP
jgi:dihydrofolate synthase/folylpolyglutamate synthase